AHGIRRGWVHANLAVPVERHKAECRVDLVAYRFEIQLVAPRDCGPIVDYGGQVAYVIIQIVVLMCRGSVQGIFETYPSYAGKTSFKKFVCQGFYGCRDFNACRTAMRRIVFKAAALGRIM